MSHVWMVNFAGKSTYDGIVTYNNENKKIIGLTHWKYA